jgi:hypothetical protein
VIFRERGPLPDPSWTAGYADVAAAELPGLLGARGQGRKPGQRRDARPAWERERSDRATAEALAAARLSGPVPVAAAAEAAGPEAEESAAPAARAGEHQAPLAGVDTEPEAELVPAPVADPEPEPVDPWAGADEDAGAQPEAAPEPEGLLMENPDVAGPGPSGADDAAREDEALARYLEGLPARDEREQGAYDWLAAELQPGMEAGQ